MQTQGSLNEVGLATLLRSIQTDRTTGTLTVQNGGDSCSLYFLFGHLFHATSSEGQGEEVVIVALGWDDGSYQFVRRGKLPTTETIRVSPADMIAAAENRRALAPPAPAEESTRTREPWPGWEPLAPPPSLLGLESAGRGEEQTRADHGTLPGAGEPSPGEAP